MNLKLQINKTITVSKHISIGIITIWLNNNIRFHSLSKACLTYILVVQQIVGLTKKVVLCFVILLLYFDAHCTGEGDVYTFKWSRTTV